jgi:hypothetical protein
VGALVVLVAIQLSVLGLYLPPVFVVTKPLPNTYTHPPQTIISLPVQTSVRAYWAVGAFVVLVAIQLFVLGLYLPPVFKGKPNGPGTPPQTIISLPVHTAVCALRPEGALLRLVAVHLSVLGLYLPPVLDPDAYWPPLAPPQTIIRLPVHTAVCALRPEGALLRLVAVHVFVLGLYFPPVLIAPDTLTPPHTIISLPVQTAVCPLRAEGALVVLVAVQLPVLGLYLRPVLKALPLVSCPPHTIISLPVHTAV